ncbi:MAG: PadR family transcriptional regulator [Clostridia bacterium]|nr:PadR family transcriptional regulator [Clostridia bacterium]
MDAQMKKGMVDVCILSILARGDSYGYQLIKDIAPLMTLSESTLYPVLRRLEGSGCLTVYSVEHNSRLRKYYAITDEGRQRIATFLSEWAEIKRVYDFIAEGSGTHAENKADGTV